MKIRQQKSPYCYGLSLMAPPWIVRALRTAHSSCFGTASLCSASNCAALCPACYPNHNRTSHLIKKKPLKKPAFQRVSLMAPPHGFEPRYQQPECRVLPLDEGGINRLSLYLLRRFLFRVNIFSHLLKKFFLPLLSKRLKNAKLKEEADRICPR